MINAEEYFEDLLIKVIEGVANEDEFATFMEIVRLDADLRSRYVQEMRFQAILSFQGEVGEKGNAGNRQSAAGCGDVSRRGAEARSHGGWWKAAAAAAVLLGGAGVKS